MVIIRHYEKSMIWNMKTILNIEAVLVIPVIKTIDYQGPMIPRGGLPCT
jgi:hypothetical protein